MITIQVHSTQVDNALAHLARRTANLQPVLNEIGIEIHRLVVDGFEHEQSPDGINWAALSPATIKKRGADAKKLRDTGSMFASLGHNASDSHVEITIGQNYAPFHQFGTSKMPARPFFPTQTLPIDWETQLIELVQAHFSS